MTASLLDGLPDGVRTDLAIHLLAGGVVTDHGDHLVVRAPYNPGYHWGNYVQVTTGDPDDADRWLGVLADAFPGAGYVAVGLPRLPAPGRWEAHGVEVTSDECLARDGLPHARPLPPGYTVRPLDGDGDWAQVRAAAARENARTGRYDPGEHARFYAAQIAARRELADAGHLAWFGAFAGDDLAADLGIVVLGDDARYQSVGTEAAHRRRGLASHLLGVAARWAHERGARRFAIVTETTNDAGRVYRSVGFEPAALSVQAYRPPAR